MVAYLSNSAPLGGETADVPEIDRKSYNFSSNTSFFTYNSISSSYGSLISAALFILKDGFSNVEFDC